VIEGNRRYVKCLYVYNKVCCEQCHCVEHQHLACTPHLTLWLLL
jgi:hypothetical protein